MRSLTRAEVRDVDRRATEAAGATTAATVS